MGGARRLQISGLVLVSIPGFAVAGDKTRALTQAMAAATIQSQPTITILPAAAGAALQSYAGGSASLSFGQAAYFGGHSAPGVTAQKSPGSMGLSTRFGLKVTCTGAPPASSAEVEFQLFAVDPSFTVSIDGVKLTALHSITVVQCGSVSEHLVEIDIPTTKAPGPISSTLSISTKPRY
jgi:hypothetical protein